MEISKYLKACSKTLLKLVCELSEDKNLIEYYEKYERVLNESEEVDYTWSLISTALLLSENLWKNESVYNSLSSHSIEVVEDKLSLGKIPIRGDEEVTNNCLLDSNNLIANPFTIKYIEFFLKEAEKTKVKAEDLDVDEKTLKDCDMAYHEYANSILEGERFGCNDAIITDDEIDYKKLIVRVRHALAHSNYEVLSNGFIRLYHYNTAEKRLDFNVALNKEVIVTILDELNETFNSSGIEFLDSWFEHRRQYIGYLKKDVDEKQLLRYLMSFGILEEKDCLDVIDKAKKEPNYKESCIEFKLDIIYELIIEKISPVCSYGIIVNEFLYGNENGLMDTEFYNKFGYYDYLNSELFKVNMESNDDISKTNKIELLLFAFLNSSLLNSVNLLNNESQIPIDFGAMEIEEEFLEEAYLHVPSYVTNLNSRLEKLQKDLDNINKKIRTKQTILEEHHMIGNEYYNTKLPNEITNSLKQKSHIIMELNNLNQISQIAEYMVLTNYILTHLRNSLAHGYIKILGEIDLNNICNVVLEFSDYNPDDKTKITFRGKIKLGELMQILTDKRYINNIIGNVRARVI